MRKTSAVIGAVAGLGIVGACAPMAAEEGAIGSASCAGKCDGAGDSLELLYGERREVGPVGDFGITAEWTDYVELGVAAGARARLVLEPHGFGEMPQISIYRDWGTSIEYVAESAPGAAEMELRAGEDSARFVVEIYGAPEASQGAIVELQCVTGECGEVVEVALATQPLRNVPSEIREVAGDDWHLFRVGASRARYVGELPVAQIARRVALASEAAVRLARDQGDDATLVQKGDIEISQVADYDGGDAALDAFSEFLDPEGGRFVRRYGEARVVYELTSASGEIVEVVQDIPVLLLLSQGAESDLAVALDRRSIF
jgi:hypothetical protein